MTDSEMIKLSPAELASALNDKETLVQVKKDATLLNHVMETLEEDLLVDTFVKNKYAPKEAVLKYPLSFVNKFVEYGFNPGTDGILDLCGISRSVKMDRAIVKLITTFNTNKYDAAFARAALNLSQVDDGVMLTETVAHLIQVSSVALVFLNELRESDTRTFVKVLQNLSGDLKTEAIKLLTYEDINRGGIGEDLSVLLFVFKVMAENGRDDVFNVWGSSSTFLPLFYDASTESKITDDEAIYFFRNVRDDNRSYSRRGSNSYRAYSASQAIPYRPAYEDISVNGSFGASLSGVPKNSKYFKQSFISGKADLTAAEAFAFIQRSYDNPSGQLDAILSSGSDEEMAELIKANDERFTDWLKANKVTPAVLRDLLDTDRPDTAKAIYGIVSSEYRKQIASRFSNLKTDSGKTSVGEKHQALVDLMESKKGGEFMEKILQYEGAGSIEANLNAFLNRHSQSTYKKKYERLSLYPEFLKKLKNEEIAMQFILSDIRLAGYYNGKFDFLSAKNALAIVNARKEDPSGALELTYEKEEYIDLLSIDQLSSLNIYNEENYGSSLDQAAQILAKKVQNGAIGERIKLSSSQLLERVARLISKKECVKHFMCSPISSYESCFNLVFAGGEKFSAHDIMEATKKASHYRVTEVLEALAFIEAKEELKEVLLAIIAPKADKFAELFPKAGNRNSELKEKAAKLLAELNPESVNVQDILKKNKHLSALFRSLGDNCIDLLIKHQPSRKPTIVLDGNTPEITKTELEALQLKYTLKAPVVQVQIQKDTRRLKYYIDLEIEVEKVDLSRIDLRSDTGPALMAEAIELCAKKPEIEMFFKDNLLAAALIEGCSDILRAYSLESIQERINNVDRLQLAHKLALPMSSSLQIATRIAHDGDMLKYAIKNEIRFDEIVVPLHDWAYRNNEKYIKKAEAIGLLLMTEDAARSREIFRHIFDASGSIVDFEPISLAQIPLGERVEVIKQLAIKNPKYKKLLSQDLSSDEFILNPPSLLDKSLLSISTFKDNLGFGVPGDLTKEQKDALSDLIVARGALIALSASNLKGFLSLADLNEVKFDDVFTKNDSKVVISEFAFFMGTKFEKLGDQARHVFSSLLKSPSKLELLSLLRDGDDDEFTMSYFKDSIRALEQVRQEINHFIALLGEDGISANTILSAMAGDNAANAMLEERMAQSDDGAAMLRDLSNAVKRVTVTVSIARKQAKAGEKVMLAETLHDSLGDLLVTTKNIIQSKGQEKRRKLKSGFEKFNELLAQPEMAVKSKDGSAHTIYFPESLGEVQSVGSAMRWCTSYNDNYFEDTIGGSAVLFNLKLKDAIVAQGFVRKGGNGWVMNQLRYASNAQAEHDFDTASIIEILKSVIKKDSKLAERYLE